MSTGNEDQDSELQKALQESIEKATALKQEITDSSSRLLNESDSLKRETESVQSEVNKELQSFNNTIMAFKKQAIETAKRIYKTADSFVSSVKTTSETAEKWSYRVLIATLAILACVIIIFVFQNYELSLTLLTPFILILCVSMCVNFTLRTMHQKFKTYENTIVEKAQEAMGEISGLVSRPLESKVDTRNISHGIQIFVKESQRVFSALGNFLPYVEKVYSWRTREHAIQVFRQSIKNSLKNFGITLDSRAEKELQIFGPAAGDENEWLEKISRTFADDLGISSEAVSLAYYEYTDNMEGKRNEWNKILEDRELLRHLTGILCKSTVVDVKYLNTEQGALGAIEELLRRMQVFSLEEFRHVYYDFYAELTRNKRILISTLVGYGLNIDDAVETEILGFVPSKTNREEWIDELLEMAAKLFSLNRDVIELILSDRIGDYPRKNKCWKKIRQNASLQDFVKFLIQHGQLQVPSFYSGSTLLVTFVSNILAKQADYDLLIIVNEVSGTFSKLDEQKKLLLRTIESFSIQFSEEKKDQFRSFMPPTLSLPEALIEYLAQETQINKDLIRLFYFDYTQDRVSRKTTFFEIVRSELVQDLASVVLQKIGIETEHEKTSSLSNMIVMLKAEVDFNIVKLQNLFWKYSNLITYSSEISSFLSDQKLSSGTSALDFETLHKIMQDKIQFNIYEQLKQLIEHMISQNTSLVLSMDTQELKDAGLAALALFLHRRGDANVGQACENAAHTKTGITSRILYQYIKLVQERKLSQRAVLLKEVVEGVMAGEYTDYSYLADFESELANGYLYRSIPELLSARFSAIERQIAKRDLLEQTLDKVKQAVRDFIDAKLHVDMVILSLNSEIFSAYLITTRSEKPVIKKVVDGSLDNLCRELAARNEIQEDFLLLETEKKTTGGKYTRVGLVPRGMAFDEFSQRFNKLFTEATKAYIESNRLPDSIEDYSLNLVRIFPSDAAFKLIKGGSEAGQEVDPTHPVNIIKRLITERLGCIENLELLAALEGKTTKTVALREIITTMFDTRTSIYLLTRQVIDSIVVGRHILLENMENKEFDKKLLAIYACKTLTELAINIHKKNERVSPEGKNIIKDEFSRNVSQIVSSYGSKLGDHRAVFSDAVFTMLDEIGIILSA